MSQGCTYAAPTSLVEALALLADPSAGAQPLAGGTALISQVQRRGRCLVSLGRLGLAGLEVRAGHVALGAMLTVAEVGRSTLEGGAGLDLLRLSCGRLASTFIRNQATLGGSTVACFRWSDLPAALLAADARMILRTVDGQRCVEATAFFETHPGRLFRDGALLTQVQVPVGRAARVAFLKLSPLAYGYATWDVAVLVPDEGGGARVAVSGGVSLPCRLPAVERCLDEGRRRREDLEPAALAALDEVGVVGSRTVSPEYRRAVGPVVVADAVAQALARGGAR